MQIKKIPKEERPIEKVLNQGVEVLSNSELITLILHSGTKSKSAMSLAEEVLTRDDDGIRFLSHCEIEELLSINGLGPVKATRLLAAVELGKRIAKANSTKDNYVENSQDVADLFMEDLRYKSKEYFKTLLLNTKGKVIYIDTVSIGNLTQTTVHPREVFRKAIQKGAASMIIIHNHPSGDPAPSKEDIRTTRRLVDVGELLGIPVLDHVIIGDGSFESFKCRGLM